MVDRMISALRRLFNEPRPTDVPPRRWWDWVLAIGFFVAVIVELSLRDPMPWRPAFLVLWPPLAFTLLWRRSTPLAALAGVMIPLAVFDVALARSDLPLPDIYTAAYALILVYAIFRWGSGREMQWGVAVLIVAVLVDTAAGFASVGDTIGGFVILLCTAEAGIVMRRQRGVIEATRNDARSREREQLARELHDTVAHHVSAIAVQAQAGRAVLELDPSKSAEAFASIEESASRALAEMRVVVDALRKDAPMAPQRGIDQIASLAPTGRLSLSVERRGALDGLAPQVDAALFRIAQESITNARRHGRGATAISIDLEGRRDDVRIVVDNDGDVVASRDDSDGHGVTGMTERATLLGGTFAAGPRPGGGWRTEAVLPRSTSRAAVATAEQNIS